MIETRFDEIRRIHEEETAKWGRSAANREIYRALAAAESRCEDLRQRVAQIISAFDRHSDIVRPYAARKTVHRQSTAEETPMGKADSSPKENLNEDRRDGAERAESLPRRAEPTDEPDGGESHPNESNDSPDAVEDERD